MKKVFLTLIALLLLSAVSMAQVGTPSSPMSWYAGAALSMPTGPEGFTDGWKLGFHGMVGAGFNVAPKLQMVGKVEYHKFGTDGSAFGSSNVEGGSFNTWLFGVDGKLNLGAPVVPVKPYALGGLGFANCKFSEFTSTDSSLQASLNASSSESTTKLYFNFGGGVEFNLGPKTSWFIHARYVSIATEGAATSFIPVTLGLRFF